MSKSPMDVVAGAIVGFIIAIPIVIIRALLVALLVMFMWNYLGLVALGLGPQLSYSQAFVFSLLVGALKE